MNTKNLYYKKLDKILSKLITDLKYVPYKLNKYSKHEVGHIYWSGLLRRVYEVVETHDEGFKVHWDNGDVTITYMPLDIKHDYELKPFEYKNYGKNILNSNCSYTAAEIKALVYTGLISNELVIEELDKYFKSDYSPKDYVYYYLTAKSRNNKDHTGISDIKIFRDLQKSPIIGK